MTKKNQENKPEMAEKTEKADKVASKTPSRIPQMEKKGDSSANSQAYFTIVGEQEAERATNLASSSLKQTGEQTKGGTTSDSEPEVKATSGESTVRISEETRRQTRCETDVEVSPVTGPGGSLTSGFTPSYSDSVKGINSPDKARGGISPPTDGEQARHNLGEGEWLRIENRKKGIADTPKRRRNSESDGEISPSVISQHKKKQSKGRKQQRA